MSHYLENLTPPGTYFKVFHSHACVYNFSGSMYEWYLKYLRIYDRGYVDWTMIHDHAHRDQLCGTPHTTHDNWMPNETVRKRDNRFWLHLRTAECNDVDTYWGTGNCNSQLVFLDNYVNLYNVDDLYGPNGVQIEGSGIL